MSGAVPALLTFGGPERFAGYVDGKLWNGHHVPLLEAEAVEALASWLERQPAECTACGAECTWEPFLGCYVHPDSPDTDHDPVVESNAAEVRALPVERVETSDAYVNLARVDLGLVFSVVQTPGGLLVSRSWCEVCDADALVVDCGEGGAHGTMRLCEVCACSDEAREVNAADLGALERLDDAACWFASKEARAC